jgi:Ca-activated chloride channel family protein
VTGLLFAHPEWLAPLVAGVAMVGGVLVWAAARGRRRLEELVGQIAVDEHHGLHAGGRPTGAGRLLRDTAPLGALALLAVALLGPRFGEGTVQLSTSGIDVVLLLDTSSSMDARDTPPSRLDAARRAAIGILGALGTGDRAALAVFSGRGVLLTPLTPDHAALSNMVPAIDSSLVKPGGSNLEGGIQTALAAFDDAEDRPRAIFVLSDGEAFEGGNRVGEVEAALANTRVLAAALGTEAGAPVPDHGVSLRDARGEIVTTRRHRAALERLANATGGRLFLADEWGHFDLE